MDKPPPFTIVIDTREQQPFAFTGLSTVRKTLKTGDYSIEGLEHRVAVERKNKQDAWGCMADSRARFERCCERLAALDRALIVIECSLIDFCDRPAQIQKVTIASAVGGYISAMVRHQIPVVWAGNRTYAERLTARFLASYFKHRATVINPDVAFAPTSTNSQENPDEQTT
jgi:ERCC4-type nuclease